MAFKAINFVFLVCSLWMSQLHSASCFVQYTGSLVTDKTISLDLGYTTVASRVGYRVQHVMRVDERPEACQQQPSALFNIQRTLITGNDDTDHSFVSKPAGKVDRQQLLDHHQRQQQQQQQQQALWQQTLQRANLLSCGSAENLVSFSRELVWNYFVSFLAASWFFPKLHFSPVVLTFAITLMKRQTLLTRTHSW